MKVKTSKGLIIEIEDKPICKGGQAGIHRIISPTAKPVMVAKIFFDSFFKNPANGMPDYSKIKAMRNRIEFMVNNNPFENAQQKVKEAFAWPTEVLFDMNNNFLGFLLPFIEDSIVLSKILSGKRLTNKWDKFDISHSNSYNTRIKICYNIAQALDVMHSSGLYTIVDLKGENIMLKSNGFISMIDLDSIQISKDKKVLFHAEVHTPDFAPPELHQGKINYKNDYIDHTWDMFSFAVLAYLIIFKVHPFGGMTYIKDNTIHTQDDFITNGFFAHGKHKKDLNLAPPHKNFALLLGKSLQKLFSECFEDAFSNAKLRPSAKAWKNELLKEIQNTAKKNITAGKNQPAALSKRMITATRKVPVIAAPLQLNNNVPATAPANTMNNCLQINKVLQLNNKFIRLSKAIKVNKNIQLNQQVLKISKKMLKIKKSNSLVTKNAIALNRKHIALKKHKKVLNKAVGSRISFKKVKALSFIKTAYSKAAMVAGLIIAAIR